MYLGARFRRDGSGNMIEFDITLTQKDMYRFNLYQTYTGFQGWLSVLAGILFVAAGVIYGKTEPLHCVLYIVFGIVLLVYLPAGLYLRSKKRFMTTDSLKKPLHYQIAEEGITVSQEGENAALPWEQIYKMTVNKSQVLIYSGRVNAFVIPRAQLGEHWGPLAELATKKLPKYRLKMKV